MKKISSQAKSRVKDKKEEARRRGLVYDPLTKRIRKAKKPGPPKKSNVVRLNNSYEFYCVATRKKVRVSPKYLCVDMTSNGRFILGGISPKCGYRVQKFISRSQALRFVSKYGLCK